MNAWCVDLFCGAGGLSLGFRQRGFGIACGVDVDPSAGESFTGHVRGSAFECRDIRTLGVDDIGWPPSARRVLLASPPCQPFSPLRAASRGHDSRSGLTEFLTGFVRNTRPDCVVVENAPRFQRSGVCAVLMKNLAELGFHIWAGVVDAADHGVPQHRRRFVVLASLHDMPVLRSATSAATRRIATVRDAIGHLPPVAAGEVHADDPLHRSSGLTTFNLERMRHTVPGGSWLDWPVELRPPPGKAFKTSYGRMSWDAPAPTLTTRLNSWASGRFGHPQQHRAITLREGALLQTFPDHCSFKGARSITGHAVQIGNAVPPALARSLAETVAATLPRFRPV